MKIALIAPNPTPQTEDLKSVAQKMGYKLDRIKLNLIKISDPKDDKTINELTSNYDVIYFRNGADRVTKMIFGKSVTMKGKVFINSGYYKNPLQSDKIFQINTVSKSGINCPKTFTLKERFDETFEKLTDELSLPFIIKPSIGAQGFGVKIVRKRNDFDKITNVSNLYQKLLQEYIPNDGDYRVITIGFKAVGTYKRVAPKNDFRANISQGGHGERVEDKDLKINLYEIAEKVSSMLNLEIAGIDIIKSKKNNKLYFVESNSIPQWQGFRETTGIDVAKKILNYFKKLTRQ